MFVTKRYLKAKLEILRKDFWSQLDWKEKVAVDRENKDLKLQIQALKEEINALKVNPKAQ